MYERPRERKREVKKRKKKKYDSRTQGEEKKLVTGEKQLQILHADDATTMEISLGRTLFWKLSIESLLE